MKKKFKLGVIGAGFMSTAIIDGALKSKIVSVDDVIVSDVNDIALEKMSKKGIAITKDNLSLINSSEYVLLAIKPQSFSSIFEGNINADGIKIISIMAGVKKQKIKSKFNSALVARCMPNTPCSIGFGAVGLDCSEFTENVDVDFICNLFSSFASVVMVGEDKLNAVTGVSGSSPAYFYLFLKGIIEAGVANGLTEEDAKSLAVATMIGAGNMVQKNTDKSLDDLINAVCSKGGTTIEAINVYDKLGLTDITKKAIDACIKRSFELENL